MDKDVVMEQKAPSGRLTDIKFSILSEIDMEKYSVLSINTVNDLNSPKLGLPNPSSQCSTCGALDAENCDGHVGIVKLPMDILHPYFISETVEILNKVCPGCKCIKGSTTKAKTTKRKRKKCKYCARGSNKWYPQLKFKVVKTNSCRKIAPEIVVEANAKVPKKFGGKDFSDVLARDYWSFIKKDPLVEGRLNSHTRTLSPAQVYYLLKEIDPKIIEKFTLRRDSLFLTFFPVIPNGIRIMEATHMLFGGKQLLFDERTKAYKKLVDFKGNADDLGLVVPDCLHVSKVFTEKSSKKDRTSGSKWIREVVLGKRTDYACRMVVVGDPNIKFGEIGMPADICEKLLMPVNINERNWQEFNALCDLDLLESGSFYLRRNSQLVTLNRMDSLQIGDTMYRTLKEGDVLLVNRPPSVHQHSLIALSVRILPKNSVFSLNPVCCSPFRGDFDGDCFHGYIPQSISSQVELRELLSIDHQLVNGQNGRNLLSMCHDSLTAAYLLREEEVFLDRFQMQQLAMACPHDLPYPAIQRAPEHQNPIWTGMQLFSMLLPSSFDYISPSNGVHLSKGEVISSSLESSWLQDTNDNIFHSLIKHYGSQSLDIQFTLQEVLLDLISMRGLSVSLSDFYLCSDSYSRSKMMEEVSCGLLEGEDAFNMKHLMVDSLHDKENQNLNIRKVGHSNNPNKAIHLSQESFNAFREVFRDVQNLIYKYCSKHNSLLAMIKAGSKGNLLKLVQQGVSLGLQHLTDTLSFKVPCGSSCAIWNHQKVLYISQRDHIPKTNVPYAVIRSSFLSGLNPAECLFHSLACRNISFSENADVPGSLTRKLMFYMRDLYMAYDGTVRNSYGNQIVEFSYDASGDAYVLGNDTTGSLSENSRCSDEDGSSVGSLAACSISEAAYSALDQPFSISGRSQLLNLKKVLESSEKKNNADRTISLFLSKKLGRWLYGYEYGALEVKKHLERVFFSDVVCNEVIVFTKHNSPAMHISPWICHFHVSKELIKSKGINVQSIVETLYQQYNSTGEKQKVSLPKLQICSGYSTCKEQKEDDATFCITVAVEISKDYHIPLDIVQDLVKPILLGAVIKGFIEFKKVDIVSADLNDAPLYYNGSPSELCMKIHIYENCKSTNCWSIVMNRCLRIMDLVDWERSHPDNTHDIFCAYGIDAAAKYYLRSLRLAVSKTILPKHLFLVTDTLSITGKFLGLNATGIAHLRNSASISSPFMQACFQNPSRSFIKAAKTGAEDALLGSLDAAAWGKEVPVGTGGKFDILFSAKGHEVASPLDVHNILISQPSSQGKDAVINVQVNERSGCEKWDTKSWCFNDNPVPKGLEGYKSHSVVFTQSLKEIVKMGISLRHILHKYRINQCINEADNSILMEAIRFHPRSLDKIGSGLQEIKIGKHPEYPNTRCFMLVRTDGSVIDFSYRKCVMGAAEAGNLTFEEQQKIKKALQNGRIDHIEE